MSMMNANAAATTAMTANEPLDFVLPEMGDADFSSEELAEDRDGFTMSFPASRFPQAAYCSLNCLPATRSTRITAPLSPA